MIKNLLVVFLITLVGLSLWVGFLACIYWVMALVMPDKVAFFLVALSGIFATAVAAIPITDSLME